MARKNAIKLADELLKINTVNNAQELQDALRYVMRRVIETMFEG